VRFLKGQSDAANKDVAPTFVDEAPGHLIGTIQAHPKGVSSLAVTPNGAFLVSGGSDNAVRVWDLATGNSVGAFTGHRSNVRALAVTPDGSRVVSTGDWSSGNWSARIWDLASYREERMLKVATALAGGTSTFGLYSLVVTSDGTRVIAGGMGRLLIWHLDTGKLAYHGVGGFSKGDDFPLSLALARDANLMVSAGGDKNVRVWNLVEVKVESKLEGHTKKVKAVAVTPDGGWVVSGGEDRTVRVWNLASGVLERTLEGHTSDVKAVALTPDGSRIVSGGKDGTVRLWDMATGRLEYTLAGHSNIQNNEVTALAVAPDGAKIASGNKDGTVRLWTL
jgi:WD40 repeat protein